MTGCSTCHFAVCTAVAPRNAAWFARGALATTVCRGNGEPYFQNYVGRKLFRDYFGYNRTFEK